MDFLKSICLCKIICLIPLLRFLSAWGDEMKQPTCVVQFENTSEPCYRFVQHEGKYYSCCTENDLSDYILAGSNNIYYRELHEFPTITLSFHTGHFVNEILVVKLLHNNRNHVTCWSLQIFDVTKLPQNEQLYYNVTFRPTMDDMDIWNNVNIYPVDICTPKSEQYDFYTSAELCSILHEANYTFQVDETRQELKLTLVMRTVMPLRVTLVRGDCQINCSNVENACIADFKTYPWTNISEPWWQSAPFGFYCIRISQMQEPSSCGAIYTQTVQMKNSSNYSIMQSLNGSKWTLFTPIIVASVFFVGIIILLVTAVVIKTEKVRPALQGVTDVECPVTSVPIKADCNAPKIFLLYSRDSPHFCNLVNAFKHLVRNYTHGQIEVIDPLEESYIEHVDRNSERWLTDILFAKHVKIVFIISEGAILRQQALLKNNVYINREPHHLDPIFNYALNHLHHNVSLSNDYHKLITIRFENYDYISREMNLTLITPHRCYTILKHFQEFICEVNTHLDGLPYNLAVESAMEEGGDECYRCEVESFKNRLQDMNTFYNENPHYFQQQWHLVH